MNYKKINRILLLPCWKGILGLGSLCIATAVLANPVLNNVASGNVAIQQAPNVETIDQSSQKAILNWQSFNIGQQQATHFIQPAGGIALNRISPTQGASQIYGMLTATGQIILVNPAGINFGPNAVVNVGGLIATTANITDQNFLNGNYQFINAGPGAITNAGQLIAADHGLIALVGNNVTNNGLIKANLGTVALASGNAFTVNFGDDMINFAVGASAGNVTNNGSLIANGGQVLITAAAAQSVLDNVINVNGEVDAKSIKDQNGEITIAGNNNSGVVTIDANINASGKHKNQTGGTVDITGYDILLNSPTLIDVSGDAGGGSVNVGGDAHGAGVLPNANATVMMPGASILANAITSGNGGNVVLWSQEVTKAYGNIFAQGGALSGNGGHVETSSHSYLDVNNINVNTSAPNGSMGSWLLDPSDIDISSTATSNTNISGSTLFTPTSQSSESTLSLSTLLAALSGSSNVTIETTAGSGPGNGDIDVNLAAGSPLSWSTNNSLTLSAYDNINIASGSVIENTTSATAALNLIANNAGAFDLGSGGTVTNNGTIDVNGPVNIFYNPSSYSSPVSYTNTGTGALTAYMLINNASEFSSINGSSSNFALSQNIDGSSLGEISDFAGNFDGQNYTISNLNLNPDSQYGGLIGQNSGNIENLQLDNEVLNINSFDTFYYGGLAGYNTGKISNIGVNNVTINSGEDIHEYIGGLIGYNSGGNISDSYATGNITLSLNTLNVGGLVGFNLHGSISNSYASVNISPGADSSNVGGFVGYNSGGTISNSYSTGSITALNTEVNSGVGGFAGVNTENGAAAVISDSYSTSPMTVSGSSSIGGFVGINDFGTATDDFWDTVTSGQASGYGSNSSGTVTALDGGCFTGTCTVQPNASSSNSGAAVNLSSAATYLGSLWNIGTALTNTWVIVNADTRPILSSEYSTTIATSHQLQLIELNATTESASYTLDDNVDLTNTSSTSDIWNGTWLPISSFSGTFNGNNYTISNLTINEPSATNVGLFGSSSGTISNLNITNASVTGATQVGILAGTNTGEITNASSTGSVTATGSGISGGLVGYNQSGQISNSYSNANVELIDNNNGDESGGLVGYNGATIINSYSSGGLVNSDSGSYSRIGGLAGGNEGTIENSWSSDTVNVPSSNTVGGLVGDSFGGPITDTYATGTVTGGDSTGGLVGVSYGTTVITSSYATGTVNGSSDTGGLVGYGICTINNSFATGTVNGTTDVGGLIGYNDGNNSGSVNYSYATGAVNGTSAVGGLVGENSGFASANNGYINNSYATGPVTGTTDVGGLIGLGTGDSSNTYSYVTDSYATGKVTGSSGTTGGLIGELTAQGSITDSFWDTDTTGQTVGIGTDAGTATNVIGGCLSGSCLSGSTVNLSSQSTYTNIGGVGGNSWNFTSTWGIVPGKSYPYLLVFYPTVPRILSGTLTGNTGGSTIGLAENGVVTTSALTNANGQFYFLEGDNVVSNINSSIDDNTPLLVYLTSGGVANYFTDAPVSGASINGITLTANTLQLGTAASNSGLAGSIAGVPAADLSYTAAGDNITLNPTVSFSTAAGSNFTLNGNISASAGSYSNITFNGSVTLGASSVTLNTGTSQGTLNILGNIIGSNDALILNINDFNGTQNSITGNISNLSSLTLTGAGAINLSGTNTYSGPTDINGGGIEVSNASALGTGAVTVGANGVLDINSVTLSGISSLTLNGTGFNGDGTIGALGTGTSAVGSSVPVILGSNTTIGSSNAGFAILGSISGGYTLTVAGMAPTTLSGDNTYSGGTIVSTIGTDNELIVDNNNTLGTGPVTIDSGATLAIDPGITLSGIPSLTLIGNGVSSDGVLITTGAGTAAISSAVPVTLGANITVGGVTNSTMNIGSAISDQGHNYSITQSGNETLILGNSDNTYGGSTIINSGTLQLGANNAIPDTSIVNIGSGGTLALSTYDETIPDLSGSGAINIGSGTLTAGNNTTLTYSGIISGSGNLIKVGTGMLTLSGANLYTGATDIDDGTLRAGIANAVDSSSDVSISNDATFALNGFNDTIGSLTGTTGTSVTLGGGTLTTGDTVDTNFGGIISGAGNLIKQGTDTFTLTNNNTYNGATTINDGTLADGTNNAMPTTTDITVTSPGIFDLNNNSQEVASIVGNGTVTNSGATTGTFTINNASADVAPDYFTGNMNLVKTNTGTLTLSNSNNNYTGYTEIIAGTLMLGANDAIPDSSGIMLDPTTLIDFNSFSNTVGSISGSGQIDFGSSTLVSDTNSNTSFSGSFIGTGGFTKEGTGTLNLTSANNSLSGVTTVSGGTLELSNADALGSSSSTIVGNGATLELNGTTPATTIALTLNGTGVGAEGALLDSGTSTWNGNLTLGSNSSIGTLLASDALTINGTINGNANLTLSGPGTITLADAVGNTQRLASFTSNAGTTNINGGTVNTTGAQNYNDPTFVGADTDFSTINSDVTFASTLDSVDDTPEAVSVDTGAGDIDFNGNIGATHQIGDMNLTSTGTTIFGGTVNASSVTTSAGGTTHINGGSVTTTNTQTYNNKVILGAATTLTGSALAMNDGVLGGHTLTMNSPGSIYLVGPFNITTLTTNGTSDSSNVTIINNLPEIVTVTGNNSGTLGGVPGIGNPVNFSDQSNLSGDGANTTYVIDAGGSLTGNIVGSGADNTLMDNNPNTTWTITGNDSGTVTGIGGTFSNIQNIIGSGNNTFDFMNGGRITGNVSASSLSSTNTLNFLNFTSPLTVQLSSNIFDGTISGGSISETFANINHLIGNGAYNNVINLPLTLSYLNSVTMTGNLQGFISDPLFFTGFTVSGNVPNVSPIIEQPWQAQLPNASLPDATFEYLDDYQDYLNRIKIDMWCYQEQNYGD